MSDELLLTIENSVARVRFNRPDKGNAMPHDWPARIADFLDAIEHDGTARCVLIEGRGKHFMSGGDLNMINAFLEAEPARREALCIATIRPWNRMIAAIQTQSRPVVCSLQGAVVGPAISLAAACDFAIGSDDSFYLFAHIMNGGSIDGMLTYFLPPIIGPRRTIELCMLGSRLSAAEAAAERVISRVVAADARARLVDDLVAKLIAGPTRAYGKIRRLVWRGQGRSMAEQSEFEAESCGRLTKSNDWVEGVRAFLGQRQLVFIGG